MGYALNELYFRCFPQCYIPTRKPSNLSFRNSRGPKIRFPDITRYMFFKMLYTNMRAQSPELLRSVIRPMITLAPLRVGK